MIGLIIGIFVAVFISTTIINSLNQEITYDTSLSCNKLKECILLDIRCLDMHIKYTFFMFKWEFDGKASFSSQRKYYIENCMYKRSLE